MTGYRLRAKDSSGYIDLYMYDQLSSGAGYCSGLGKISNELLEKARSIMTDCHCDTACYECIKHYKNTYVQGDLDRRAGVDLLNWGIDGKVPDYKSVNDQFDMVYQYEAILGSKVDIKLVVYPSMLKTKNEKDVLYVSEFDLKYRRPQFIKLVNSWLNSI